MARLASQLFAAPDRGTACAVLLYSVPYASDLSTTSYAFISSANSKDWFQWSFHWARTDSLGICKRVCGSDISLPSKDWTARRTRAASALKPSHRSSALLRVVKSGSEVRLWGMSASSFQQLPPSCRDKRSSLQDMLRLQKRGVESTGQTQVLLSHVT